MSAGRLRHTLVVRHPDTLEATALLADSEVPDWAKSLVPADNLVDGSDDTDKAPAKKAASSRTKK